ncbi:MAG: HugZ family pyridoxamine 5'-phosphate oxidase [Methylotenera sp.]
MSLALEARQFLRSTQSGMLSTFSAKFPGYPFGSVTPFVLDHSGQPVILISAIAEHTKNILANPKVSLLVFAGGEDLQANARLTLIGQATQADKEDANLRARYLRYLPQAASYFDMHDFRFYRIEIAQARYIAGFGKMDWLSGDQFSNVQLLGDETSSETQQLAEQETAIIEHMNADHADSLNAYCRHFHGINATNAQMLGIDSDGFDVRANVIHHAESQTQNQATTLTPILRFNFEHPIHDAQSARLALVSMSKAAKP